MIGIRRVQARPWKGLDIGRFFGEIPGMSDEGTTLSRTTFEVQIDRPSSSTIRISR